MFAPNVEEVVIGEVAIGGYRGVMTYRSDKIEIEPPDYAAKAQKSVYVVHQGVLYVFSVHSDAPEIRYFFDNFEFIDE